MAIEDGQVFGAARKWGAIGFALGVFIAGRISEAIGLSVIFFIYTCCFLATAGIIYFMLLKNRDKSIIGIIERREKGGRAAIFKNKKFILLVICAFFINGTIVANNTYFGFLFIEGGGTISGIGLVFLFMIGSEALFMALEDRIAGIFTFERILLAAMCVSAARFVFYAFAPSSGMLMATFIFHGMAVGVVLVGFVKYVAEITDRKELGLAISMYYALGSSLSTVFCQMAGGVILDHFNVAGIYIFFACMNLAGVLIYVAGKLYTNASEKSSKKSSSY
jgi:PPP family 3-phenylpropionic acid transporter